MAKADPCVSYIADVPPLFMQTLISESSVINKKTSAERSRVFFKSRGLSYNVSNYSEQKFSKKPTQEIQKILDWILSIFPEYSIFWANILSMSPKQRYPVHVDGKIFHYYAKRLHIPITYSQESYHIHFIKENGSWNSLINKMDEGKLYEFNNITPHSAINNSNKMRNVFVVDILPTELLLSRSDWLDVKVDVSIETSKVDLEFAKDEQLSFWCYREVSKNEQF